MNPLVHWRLGRIIDVPDGTGWLSAAECALVSRDARPKRQREWRLGRWTAKQLLADVHGWTGAELLRADDGSPVAWCDGTVLPVSVSLSHRDHLGLCCVAAAGVALGCDIERIEPRRSAFVGDYFTAGEQDAVARAAAIARDTVVTAIWSAKESALKALRSGLRRDTRSVEVILAGAPAPGAWSALNVVDRSGGTTFHGWWQNTATDGASYTVTIVADTALAPHRSGACDSSEGRTS